VALAGIYSFHEEGIPQHEALMQSADETVPLLQATAEMPPPDALRLGTSSVAVLQARRDLVDAVSLTLSQQEAGKACRQRAC
jgi:hypothetical protein